MQKSPRPATELDELGRVPQALGVRLARGTVGPPGMSPRMAMTCRIPTDAYAPTTCRSSSRLWLAAVRWAIGRRVVCSAICWVAVTVRSRVEPGRAVRHRDEVRPEGLELADRRPQLAVLLLVTQRGRARRRPAAGRRPRGAARRWAHAPGRTERARAATTADPGTTTTIGVCPSPGP